MTTRVRKDGVDMATDAEISRAADTLRRGRLVAFPTETVYGLAADADNAGALHARRFRGGILWNPPQLTKELDSLASV